MGFPSVSDSSLSSRSEKERAKKAAWKAEIEELRARKEARDKAATALPVDGELGYLVGVLNSKGFTEVYEDLTGKNAGEWVRSVLKASVYVLNLSGITLEEHIRSKIADLAAKYYWGEPWYRVHLAQQLVKAKGRRERRSLRMRMATPTWANPLKIAAIYRKRDRMTLETGIEHEVDHIIPLTHPRVCGLHCEANLEVITAAENRAKSNRFYI